MKISYKWLQTYFDEKLPTPDALAERLALAFAEVEGIERKNGDAILDIKVLPDRACYALSHRGIAREVAAIFELEMKETEIPALRASRGVDAVPVRVTENPFCPRYTARRIERVHVATSPRWLRERLESIDERSINNIVDATNFVMFDIGQPLHAFDADKVQGGIVVRTAKTGERLTTLDGKELMLDEHILVIADEAGPLALAGVKGGKRAEVTKNTSAIILETASFDAAYTRRAAQKFGVRTESSRRFENNLSPHLAREGSDACAALIAGLVPGARFGKITDLFSQKMKPKSIPVAPSFIARSLGIEISPKDIRAALARLALHASTQATAGKPAKKRGNLLIITPPPERRDLARAEDLVEEVGRIVGYERVPEAELPPVFAPPFTNKRLSVENAIRDWLMLEGFSEVMTSSFAPIGDIEIEKPLAEDKKFLRNDLWFNFEHSLIKNKKNAPLFCFTEIKQFEIGKVFERTGEHLSLAIGYFGEKKMSKLVLRDTVANLEKALGVRLGGKLVGGQNVYECTLPEKIHPPSPPSFVKEGGGGEFVHFAPFSSYPFIVRDVAFFVPVGMSTERAEDIIKGETRGKGVVSLRLFDSFEKAMPDGMRKPSYAFRLVFQSMTRTLTDAEANATMEGVYRVLRSRGCEIR